MSDAKQSEVVIECRDMGIWFTRGSRRTMLRQAMRRAFGRTVPEDSRFWALRHVDVDVRAGVRLGVCGSNGSGKTTLMRVLSGIYGHDEGIIDRREGTMSLLSLGAGISHHLSGRDNIYLLGSLNGLPRDQITELYAEIQDFCELDDDVLRTPVRYYSNGMRTRLGFAIVAFITPDVLFLDEIMAVGDTTFRSKSAAKLQELARRARCVVICSHDIGFLKRHCDEAVWLHEGVVRASGDAVPVLNEYADFAISARQVS